MPSETVVCSFPDLEASAADILAHDLLDDVEQNIEDAQVSRERTNPLNQDFGATVIIVLGTPVMIKLADGISKWIARRSDAKIELNRTDTKGRKRTVTVSGQLGKRGDQLIREFFTD